VRHGKAKTKESGLPGLAGAQNAKFEANVL
jgi:hypothetical protein